MKRLFVISLLVFIFHAIDVQAANYYVRAGATGANNGSDWTNAWTQLPATLVRGNTYYIADGSYGGYTFDDAVDGTKVITIKKATIADYGTDTGWSDSYGDGVAIFTGRWLINTNYWVIDGVVGSGNSGHGFKIDMTSVSGANLAIKSYGSYITLRHIHTYWPDNRSETYMTPTGTSGGIEFYHTSGVPPTDVTIQYCYLEKTPGYPFRFVGTNNLLLENCYVYRMFSDAARHASGVIIRDISSSGGVIRNNYFEQTEGSYSIGFYNASTLTEYDDWQIYGNVFAWYDAIGSVSHVIAYNFNDNIIVNNLIIYNNVFYDSRALSSSTYGKIVFGGGKNKYVYNNIFYGMKYHYFGGVIYDYNYYSNCKSPFAFSPGDNENPWYNGDDGKYSTITADPFVNSTGKNFRLSAILSGYPGLSLSSLYDPFDPDGNTRGADGTWDRGAYEYVAGSPVPNPTPPTVSLTAPTSGSTVSDTITVSANASDNIGVAGVQFKLDGANIGSEDTTSPYSISWNTATASNGSHTLTATARDTSGNITTSLAIAVTVSNSYTLPPLPPLPPPPDGNLIAAYNFNEGSGTTLFDCSGNNNNGSLYGAAWTAVGKYAGALDFNGVTSYIDIPNSSTINITGDALTLEAWVNTDVLGTNMIASKPVSSSSHTSPYFSYSLHTYPGGTPRFCITTIGGTLSCVSSSQILTSNTWHHVAGVYDGYSLTIYVNGIVRGTFAISGSIKGYTTPLRLGANGGFGENFGGRIDDIRIYNRALSASEIQTDMNTPLGADSLAPDWPTRLSVQ